MASRKIETFSKMEREVGREDIRKKAILRLEIQNQNGSCLSCIHTKTSIGAMLHCSLKNKKVSQYNYCDKWRIEQNESKGNSGTETE